jgi:hypothetical protein
MRRYPVQEQSFEEVYFMSESDKDAIIGKAVREHAEAEKNLEFLAKEAKHIASRLKRLSEAFGEESSGKLVDHAER